jgi:hypothetical protein
MPRAVKKDEKKKKKKKKEEEKKRRTTTNSQRCRRREEDRIEWSCTFMHNSRKTLLVVGATNCEHTETNYLLLDRTTILLWRRTSTTIAI